MRSELLKKAITAKNDEFYTQIKDIQKEVIHYWHNFNNKIIYMNCDNYEESMFWSYFKCNFKLLNIKKIVATYFDSEKPAYKAEYTGREVVVTRLLQNGDFRSDESIEILQEADIVVTNPPFSLLREYIVQLMEHNKKFLIMGHVHCLSYKTVFPLIKNNKLWLGTTANKSVEFRLPSHYEKWDRIDDNGYKCGIVGGITWFTNLRVAKKGGRLNLTAEYDPTKYPEYDNIKAIEVSKMKDLPKDYDGVMGVPVTYLIDHDPDEFIILGTNEDVKYGDLTYLQKEGFDGRYDIASLNGKYIFRRVLIKRRK